jgi:hypothetical protein
MVVMPTDDFVLISLWFFRDAVIDNHYRLIALDTAPKGFGDLQ